MSDIFAPLFEVASKLIMKDEVPFHFDVGTFINNQGNRCHLVSWWISKETQSIEEDSLARFDVIQDIITHTMYTDDINEDMLNDWVVELTEVLELG